MVLFSPKPNLSAADRLALLDTLAAASTQIPSIKRLRVGRRVKHSLPGYEQLMRDDYEFAVMIEFEDLAGLKSYLQHPSHAAAGRHFTESADRSLAYDYELAESLITDH